MTSLFRNNLPKISNFLQFRNQGCARVGASSSVKRTSNETQPVVRLETNQVTIFDCKDIESAIKLFESEDIGEELLNSEKVLQLSITVQEDFRDLHQKELEELSKKCHNKSIVIFIASENDKQLSIHWKSQKISSFLALKYHTKEFSKHDQQIYGYIADFLVDSLSKGELGLYSEWSEYSNGNEVGTHLLADFRGYNLLLIAAEAGNTEIVKILLDFGANTVADDGVSAQSLAWKNRHSEVLLVLAQANLPYPEGIDINQLSDDFRTFYKKTEELHEATIAKNEEKVKEILNRDRNLEFYFDLSNKSAARIAVDAKAFNIYEVLVIHEIFLAPHEYQQGIFDDLEYEEQRVIRELHHKHSKDLPEKHINILMAHSSIAHDVTDTHEKLKHVYKAYKYLSQDPRLNTILKVVATSKKFQIIYDFNRDAVNIADPTVSDNTEGVFYPMGRIYIGAKQLLDESTRSQAMTTLAHELCHFAVNLVYSNDARPYKDNDNKIMQEFETINEKCQKEQGKEKIVDLVYECYPTDMYHAELIVRPAHMIAMYIDQPEKLAEVGEIFPELFEFFDRVIKEMEGAIPEIERRDEKILEKKDEKISRLRKKLVLSAIFSVIGIIAVAAVVALIFYKPFYSFKELSANDKLLVKDGRVNYKNVEVRFHDLFPENSTAYEKLTSDHISQIFDGHALNFSDSHFLYLNDLVHHDWQNLEQNLKQKFLTSNFTFQNESLKLEKLKETNSEVFNSLTSEQIVDVLDGKELIVGKMIENKTEFYVERRFVFEGQAANALNVTYFINTEDTLEDIIDKTTKTRLLTLSSEAGAGKTVTFEQLAMRIKRKYPMRWVSYIDLKEYIRFYNISSENVDVKRLLYDILNLSSDNEFEKQIFDERYSSGNVVLLWNGFDEISPTHTNFTKSVLLEIYNSSRNVQYISTRPLYSGLLQHIFVIRSNQLIPFNAIEQKEFLRKFFVTQKINDSKLENYIEKVNNISFTYGFITPLMLKLIGEIHEEGELLEKDNFYKIFQIFIEKKVNAWQNSEYAKNVTTKLLFGSSKLTIIELHQNYALKNALPFNIKALKLKILQKSLPKFLRHEDISRMGILYIDNPFRYSFAHRTFIEFLLVQYFIENIYMADYDLGIDEAELRIETFIYLTVYSKGKVGLYLKFLDNFVSSDEANSDEKFSPAISKLFRSNYKRFFIDIIQILDVDLLEILIKFFKRDHDVLIELLHVNNDETLYTAAFNPIYSSQNLNPEGLLKLVQNYLINDEFERFRNGNNQRGKILLGIQLYRFLNISKNHYKYDVTNGVTSVDKFYDFQEEIAANLTRNERKELLSVLLQPSIYTNKFFFYSHYEENWPKIVNLTSRKELRSLVGRTIKNFCEVCPPANTPFNKILLNKTEELFSNDEIFDIFTTESILHKAVLKSFYFETFWDVLNRHTNQTDRRLILTQESPLQFIKYYAANNLIHRFFAYDYRSFNIFQTGVSFCHDQQFFFKLMSIYEANFNISELQQIIVKSNDFLLYSIAYSDVGFISAFIFYLETLFFGNEHLLVEFFMRNINLTNKHIFDYVRYFPLDNFKTNIVQVYYNFYLGMKSKVDKVPFVPKPVFLEPPK